MTTRNRLFIPGLVLVHLSLAFLQIACDSSSPTSSPALSLVRVAGSGQQGTPGDTLAAPLVVRVTNRNGTAAQGHRVDFSIAENAGSLTIGSALSDENGEASTGLILGDETGEIGITAVLVGAEGDSVQFVATVVEMPNAAPVAHAGLDQNGIAGDVFRFDAAGSSDQDGVIASFAWDFGDGNQGTGASVDHVYLSGGSFVVTLTVTDERGAHSTDTIGIVVSSPMALESGVFVVTSDFTTGSTAFLALDAEAADTDLLAVHSDAVARFFDGKVYIINRLGADNILVLDEGDLRTPLVQFSVGNGSNPQDIEVLSADKAYVTRLARTELAIVDPRNGDELGTIDLSAFADDDGFPEMTQMAQAGSRVYVLTQRLDTNDPFYAPTGTSYVVVIDTDTDSLVDMDDSTDGVQGIELAAPNPNAIVAIGSKLIVSEVASFSDRSGGIEVLELSVDGSEVSSHGLVIGETALGGDINTIAMADESRGYAIISDENFANHVVPFDLATGEVGARLEELSTGFMQSLEIDGDRLIVADPGTFADPDGAGLMIFDVTSAELVAGPISTGLPPVSIAILD